MHVEEFDFGLGRQAGFLGERPDALLSKLFELLFRLPHVHHSGRDVLVVARPSLPPPVAATSWHKRLLCERAERTTLLRFVEEYRNDGPEKVPH